MSRKANRNIVQLTPDEHGDRFTRKTDAKREGEYVVANREPVETDHMPKEVATEMLLAPKVHLSNRERKVYMKARWNIFRSTLQQKITSDQLGEKLKGASWAQINRWLERVPPRRRIAQSKYEQSIAAQRPVEEIEKLPDKEAREEATLKNAMLTVRADAMNVLAGQLDVYLEALETEIERRQNFIAHLKTVSESTAKAVEKNLCPA